MAEENDAIKTGIDYESGVAHYETHDETEVYGYADDGEHAVVWAVQTDEAAGKYLVTVFNCEAGLADAVGRHDQPLDEFDSANAVARHFAESDPETSVAEARDYWADK